MCAHLCVCVCARVCACVFLLTVGYRISRETLDCIIQRYSKDDSIYFDDYVACCIKLRTMCGRINIYQTDRHKHTYTHIDYTHTTVTTQ